MAVLQVHLGSALQGFAGLGQAGRIGLARVLKRSTTTAQTFMARSVAHDMGLPVKKVNEAISVSIREHEGVARIIATGSRLALALFKARGPKPSRGRGKVTADTGQGLFTVEGGFFATVGIGRHLGIFVRTLPSKNKSAGAWSANLPIRERFGPSIAHVFGKYLPQGAEVAEDALQTNAAHELSFALNRGR